MRPLSSLITVAALGAAHAQFTDLQPGRNFPDEVALGSNSTSESIDLGDVDGDGDLDAVVGAGGYVGLTTNRIFVNQGGRQGGIEGTFVDETAVLFAGLPDSPTRDIDFGDVDGDGDLDLVESSRGAFEGNVIRIHVNQGGAQGGTAGTYEDATDTAWRLLSTVRPANQLFGGDEGPWNTWSCDCDFGDLDDDGDLDLFASGYGPFIEGGEPSRVFLNDGAGVFDEHAPWADLDAEIEWRCLDVELIDLDGDFDLDIFATSRESASRVFVNNTHAPLPFARTMFTETTAETFAAPGSFGNSVYGAEFGDYDLDGDFDIWALNWAGFSDRRLTNGGTAAGTAPALVPETAAFGDSGTHDVDADHLDFDGDGDLDTFAANFSGTNWLYASGLAQGIDGYHRTGTTIGGSLYAFGETPDSPFGIAWEADVGDLDGDGDPDVAFVNDSGVIDRLWINALGVPDTHAPTFARVTEPDSLALAGEVVIHAAVRDNESVAMVAFHDVDLVVSVDGGPEQRIDMTHSGSMIFRAALDLGAGATSLAYRVEAVDGAGNVGISSTFVATGDWTDLGGGLAGVDGIPALSPSGTLAPGATGTLALTEAAPSAAALLALSAPTAGAPFKGGVLLAVPFDLAIPLTTSPAGTLALPYAIPGDAPSGVAFHLQLLVADPAAIQGIALSNGLRGDVP